MPQFQIIHLTDAPKNSEIGGKAKGLRFLARHGFAAPDAWLLTASDERFEDAAPASIAAVLEQRLPSDLASGADLAVRSSASVEDQADQAFAGQFRSALNVRGPEAVAQAALDVFRSVRSDRVADYCRRNGIDPSSIRMTVVLQPMVDAKLSGVSFSRNPLTGFDEVVVEAVEGLGESLVQGGVTPERWIEKWGEWVQAPRDRSREAVVREVVEGTRRAAEAYGSPVDLEWAWDGERLSWLQVRPITAFDSENVYSNRIAREVLPGRIQPLVWSVNVPLVNGAWISIFTELIGKNDLRPDDLARPFAFRAYFNMGTIGRILDELGMPRETLEIMMGLEGGVKRPRFRPGPRALRHVPRMLRFAWTKLRFESELRRLLPELRERFAPFADAPVDQMTAAEALADVDRLFPVAQRAAYVNIVTPILMSVYNYRLEAKLKQQGVDYAEFDVAKGFNEIDRYDPNARLNELRSAYHALDPHDQAALRQEAGKSDDSEQVALFRASLVAFLTEFGHLSDSGNDFSKPCWREEPQTVLALLAGPPTDSPGRGGRGWEDLDLAADVRKRLTPLYEKARRFRAHREAAGSLYTLGYGLFRRRFLRIAELWTQTGVLAERDDVFFLSLDEVRALVDRSLEPSEASERIRRRRREYHAAADASLPPVIFGDNPPPLSITVDDPNSMDGTPTSRGYFEGSVCIVHSVAEFPKIERGSVLVIPYSDVSWTPLFAQAGAIVAESGGMLSHSSIVAREYGVPAVVSVTGACTRLSDGMRVAVDGYQGKVRLVSDDEAAAP